MILLTTIQNKLQNKKIDISFFDVRYLGRWVRLYPEAFPKYILRNNYITIFNEKKLRWEFQKIKKI
jgi:hypothetical protein